MLHSGSSTGPGSPASRHTPEEFIGRTGRGPHITPLWLA